MVASVGKQSFYSAIWILTALRVGCFLAAAGPVTWYAFDTLLGTENSMKLLSNDPIEITIWLTTITTGLGLATIIASVADLKQRHHLLSIVYKYVPLLVCMGGAIVWGGSFIFESQVFQLLRTLIGATPLIGIVPALVAPVFKIPYTVLAINSLLTIMLTISILKWNARWFAAHLEEV